MLVSFTGAQSTGKTTLLNLCKEENHQFFKPFEFVDSITRKVASHGAEINIPTTWVEGDLTQALIIGTHVQNSFYKNTILDRCIIDGLLYTEHLWIEKKVSGFSAEYARHIFELLMPKYDLILYPDPTGVPLVNDKVRSVNTEFRDIMINAFEHIVTFHPLVKSKVVRLTGSIEDRRIRILQAINARLR